MAPPTGTNCLTNAEDRLRSMLANCAACQSFLGAANATEALLRIYVDQATRPADREAYTDAEIETVYPLVVISTDDEGYSWVLDGLPKSFGESGQLVVRFANEIAEADQHNPEKYFRDHKNAVGDIVEDMIAINGDDGYVSLTSLSYQGTEEQAHDDEQDEDNLIFSTLLVTHSSIVEQG